MLIIGFLKTTRIMPLKLVHALGGFIGWVLYILPTDSKKTTVKNLQLCFPEITGKEIARLACKSLGETVKTGIELGKVWLNPVEEVLQLVSNVQNEKLIETALLRGKGLIIAAPHLGNWEVYGLKITTFGPTTYLYKPPRLPGFESSMTAFRSRGGASIVPTNRQGVMQLVKALQRGEIIGILPDQEPDRNGGIFAPFFGMDALTMTLISKLAAHTGATVLCGYAKRVPHSQGFEVIFRETDSDIASEDVLVSATALNKAVESCVREAPEQYQWEYKRFKKRPPGDDRLLYSRRR